MICNEDYSIQMGLLKRTYAFRSETLERFEQAVESGKRSAVIEDLINQWLDNREQQRLREEVIEGCREMAEIYLKIEQEYHPLEEEAHRAHVKRHQTRGRHRRPA